MLEKKDKVSLTVNVLIKKEDDLWIAHCLELDIVATGTSSAEAAREIKDLIKAQISYAFANDNLNNLFKPAPSEVWREFYECKQAVENQLKIDPDLETDKELQSFVPPWIIANICEQNNSLCYA